MKYIKVQFSIEYPACAGIYPAGITTEAAQARFDYEQIQTALNDGNLEIISDLILAYGVKTDVFVVSEESVNEEKVS
jgi:hypothetical protein